MRVPEEIALAFIIGTLSIPNSKYPRRERVSRDKKLSFYVLNISAAAESGLCVDSYFEIYKPRGVCAALQGDN
jgi:hypothetical protein